MGEGCEHAKHRKFAHVALAEIGFKSPDRHQDLPRHAVLGLDARQQRGVTLQHGAAAIDPARADPGRDILLERLGEGAALPAVEGKHARVHLHPAERLRDHALAKRLRFAHRPKSSR